MLRLAGHCSPARCGRAECTHCRVTCVACFWTKQGSGACAFHCHPRDAAVFPLVLEHSQPASPHFVRFVEPSLFHVLTFAVLHWRASFDGMARIWTRAASDNAAALSRLTVLVQETFLQRCCREHVCAIGAEAHAAIDFVVYAHTAASSGRTPAAHPAWMLAERDFDTCGPAKPLPTLGARRTGGVLTFVLACGTVCHVSACAGGESCTQICGLLGDIRSRRDVQFVVYDNACMLARFVRNRAARRRGRGSSTLQQLASECNYVLDRFHARNHRACLNPQHALYLPEVDIARHPTLAALNTSQNEQWNNWLGHFSHTLRHMHFRTMELYLLLVADLWNTFVVPCRSTGDATPQPSACEERPTSSSLLKRRREQPARRVE
ncbi:hypothetical protein AK812_SmicGene35413 [Symbiodinium microadriaticum]|uniref:CxC6 like cysteine cluster associated with KDZ domain-containing protein n=1 Tax=Symbiodinium microadriaticum TaxID=2951 RepID=A0A1Q9CLJ7_SYMMI|nr:hypothetical protein AK812_SmicGene35413 [Symbiodinium microadriaticum]